MIAYVITEGPSDQALLKAVLPEHLLREVRFVAAGGLSSMASLARSLLADRRVPVLIVADADTIDPESIQDRRQSIEEAVAYVAHSIPVKVVLAVPEIESVFFRDAALLSRWLGYSPSPELLAMAHYQPRQALLKLLAPAQKEIIHLLSDPLHESEIETLRDIPFIREIIQFLSAISPDRATLPQSKPIQNHA
ncbi:hypothetical protein [Methylomagnum ishizawai]|uniref:hypothetical protein n=1 Tax=Methylomagnum ishizawai TaxID=1760988 RepID=UPI001C323D6F|nr:hypothetical protein [Methylomagnum ishizawai]BBL74058.1 hypothetical protein MishRS11D_11560 [Methylomagnum ishizawai]